MSSEFGKVYCQYRSTVWECKYNTDFRHSLTEKQNSDNTVAFLPFSVSFFSRWECGSFGYILAIWGWALGMESTQAQEMTQHGVLPTLAGADIPGRGDLYTVIGGPRRLPRKERVACIRRGCSAVSFWQFPQLLLLVSNCGPSEITYFRPSHYFIMTHGVANFCDSKLRD